MVKQVKTKDCSLKSIIHRAAFVRGFKEVKDGITMDYDAFTGPYEDTNDRWAYERGRLFGYLFNGRLKDGKRVTWEAQAVMGEAIYSGAIF